MTRRLLTYLAIGLAATLVVGALVASVLVATHWHQFLEWIGVLPRNPVSSTYNFWSGFGSDMGEVTLVSLAFGFAAAFWHKHNCHVQECLRLSWKQWVDPDGHTHALCKKHHPHDPPTAALIAERAAREGS